MLDHIHGDVEHNGGLLAVGSAGVYLRFPLVVVAEHVQSDCRAQFALAVLLRNLDVSGGVLPLVGVIVPDRAEHIRHDLLLPGQQREGLSVELSLGVLQTLDEPDHAPRFPFIKAHVTTRPSEGIP